ncbi:peptidase, M23 family [Pyramidobacter piscolens W5455]|uniref:Peptidase, M23 family n=2 Tax=Pyramidobacter TaxID=638847 RepID=A0ABP2HQN4_9BACT|nr:peptidoglycan DD-metalloendopeptidase family protein [Pyramidobacter piscolens]EFB89521.1 peptidase, M23 family [Pyramidobacter piscolens W5455]BDF79134.1 hypothetical protein CE91St28_19280 [Pyramidobacter piscolens]
MDRLDKKNNRRVFWSLMGSMILATAGAISLAVFKAEDLPAYKDFPLSAFFPSFEARAALAHGQMVQLERENTSGVISPLLPDSPEFEESGLMLDEVVPEEDPLGGGRLAILPAMNEDQSFDQPLPVHDPFMTLSLSELSNQKADDSNVIVRLLGEKDEMDEDIDERPWLEHTVGQGERMVDISRKYGILVATISKANNIRNPDRLSSGQVLLIPRTEDLLEDVLEEQKSRAEEKLASKQRADPVKYRKYTVKPGDSLWTIASANNLSIDSLYGTNILRTPDRLSPGIVLRIPNQDGLSVKIAKGQTLNALAKKYGVAERAIRMANGLSDKVELNAGQEVFIPGASQSIAVYRGSSSGGGMSRTAPPVAKAATGAAGRFSWPVVGKISSPFGWRRHPIRRARLFHAGIDIRAPRHTPIRASRGGQVIFSGWMNGYGRTVIIRHDSTYTTLYGHCQSLMIRKGQNVKKGTVIATVGSSGRATGPHVHFEVRRNDSPTNPMSYLR